MANDYYWYKEQGICVVCHHAKALAGRTRCAECDDVIAERQRKYTAKHKADLLERNRKRYAAQKAAGKCVRCSKPATHGTLCLEHWLERKRINREQMDKHRTTDLPRGDCVFAQRRRAHVCMWRADPLPDGYTSAFCPACLEKAKANLDRARAKSSFGATNDKIWKALRTKK